MDKTQKGLSKAETLLIVFGVLGLVAAGVFGYQWYQSTHREKALTQLLDQERAKLREAPALRDNKFLQEYLSQGQASQASQAAILAAVNKLVDLEQKRGQQIQPPPPLDIPVAPPSPSSDPTQAPPPAPQPTEAKVEPINPDKATAGDDAKGDLGSIAMGAALAACVAIPPSCAAFLALASAFGGLSLGEQQTIVKSLQNIALKGTPSPEDLAKLTEIVAKHPDLVAKVQAAGASSDQYKILAGNLEKIRAKLVSDADTLVKTLNLPTENVEKCKAELALVIGSSTVDRFRYEAIKRKLGEKSPDLAVQCIAVLTVTDSAGRGVK